MVIGMDTSIATSLISGLFAVAAALGSVWLKHYLERQKESGNSPISHNEQGSGAIRPAVILACGYLAGALYRTFKGDSGISTENAAVIGFWIFSIVSFIALTLYHRRSARGFWPYQMDTLALWTAFFPGFFFAFGNVRTDRDFFDAASTWIGFWLAFAILGGLAMVIMRPRRHGA